MDNVLDHIIRILTEQLGVDVTATSRLRTDLGADSLDAIEVVMAFEEEFNVDIPDDEAVKLDDATPTEFAAYIEQKVNAKRKGA